MAHIAIFLPSLGGGGAERAMLNLARGFCDQSIRTDLVVATSDGELASEVHLGVNVVDLAVPRTVLALPGLIQYLRRTRPDAFLSTMTHANIVSILAARLSLTPVRVFVREATTMSKEHAEAHTTAARVSFGLVRRLYPLSDGIIAPSVGAAKDLQCYLPSTQIDIIPNPVITPDFESLSQLQVEHPFLREKAVFLAVGRLSKAKDYPTLLRAFRIVRETVDARLIILGEGELRKFLTGLVMEMKLKPYVSLPGFVTNPIAFMRRASVFVLSSRWEGLPNVLIQALACGCPVVSTDCESGPREILDNGRLGRLVSVGAPESLARAMLATLLEGRTEIDQGELRSYLLSTVARQYIDRLLG